MKTMTLALVLMVMSSAYAVESQPTGVACMKKAKGLGMSMVDAYQTCFSVSNPRVRSCIFKQQTENKGTAESKSELKSLGKSAIKECQE